MRLAGRDGPAAVAAQLGDALAEAEGDAVAAVQAGEDLAELGAERAQQRRAASGSTMVTSQPACRAAAAASRPIQPAPATTTLAALPEPGGQRRVVGHGAQVHQPVQVGAGDRQPAGRGAGGEQQPGVAECGAVLQPDLPGAAVEGGDPVPSRRSTSCSAYQRASCTKAESAVLLPSRTSLDSGGRS